MMNWPGVSPAATPLQEPGPPVAAADAAAMAAMPPRLQSQVHLRPVVHAEQAAADAGKEVGTVVLTVKSSLYQKSYDELFTTVPQQGSAGTRVSVYECTYQALAQILSAVATPAAAATTAFEQLAADIDRKSVV
jgi:hypothetical protein